MDDPNLPLDLRSLRDEIEAGLPNHLDALSDAAENLDFAESRFNAYPVRPPYGDNWIKPAYERRSDFMGRVTSVLSELLYATEPTRTLPGQPEATDFLHRVYSANASDALWQHADRLTAVSDSVAFQVAGTADPASPIRIFLWDASTFAVWCDPEDPIKPVAVVTKDKYNTQTRYRLWTAGIVETYLTKRADGLTAGGRVASLVESIANPYGVLPFAFAHYHYPVQCFHSGGPGTQLRKAADYISYHLTRTGDDLTYYSRPLLVAEGVSGLFRLPTPLQAGDCVVLPPYAADALANATKPNLRYVEADVASITDANWRDLQAYISHTLQTHGVPEDAVRVERTGDQSGFALLVEQAPLVKAARSRQKPFSRYETDLARVVLQVAAAHLEANGADAKALRAALAEFSLTLKWPSLWAEIPGPEKDRQTAFDLAMGITSKLAIVQERYGLTEEEALAYLTKVAADNEALEKIGIDPRPPAAVPLTSPEPAGSPDSATEVKDGSEDRDTA